MSRYTGSINRKSRRLKFSLLENNKEFSKGKKRTTVPGQHGGARAKTPSEYKLQLTEKQKVALMYGLNDTQMKRFILMARKMKGSNSLNLLILLESRIDNLVYRMGFAPTRRASRQLVTHGHVLVNGKKISIPSFIVDVNSEITIKEKSKKLPVVNAIDANATRIAFVTVDVSNKSGKYIRLPERSELNPELKESFVIEYYNRII
ncbi:MAG: 30S ribosomal protein S4 [Mycoplasmataceae bacterium]|jgi:small subunit ribosomal protein S4|nr:30S ribosomal protein S4 [Mycoplasmataceae bacterium]